jgi:1,4-alpha-glucan branching enzyme
MSTTEPAVLAEPSPEPSPGPSPEPPPDPTSSERVEGMGAVPHPGGVAFRVWAPHADEVSVVGTFNDWDPDADPLSGDGEGDGYWYADVPAASPGDEYRLVITAGDRVLERIDPYARQVTSSVGNGVIYDHAAFDWGDDDFRCPPHDELVVYETHIGSFASDGDGPSSLDDVRAQLDHLDHLGVNAVQLMPVAEFAGDLSWGYNPAHLFAVESAYGGPDALKAFVRDAHRRGIAVILDVVYNHFGPSDLDLWQFDGWHEDDKGGIYFYNDERSATPWGDTRPDYGREEVRRFIHDNAMSWLADFHLDGLRFDMTLYMRRVDAGDAADIPDGWSLLQWINRDVRERFPDRITIAEDLQDDPALTRSGDDGAGFHAQWDAGFVHPIRHALTVPDDAERSVAAVAGSIDAPAADAFTRVIYTESHDEVANGKARVPHEVDAEDPTGWHAQKRATLGAALTMTAPGIPMLFQGQEFLQGAWFRDDVPLDWDQAEELHGIVLLHRDLIRLRRNLDGTSRGLTGPHVRILEAEEETKLLAYHRWRDGGPGDDVVVVVNLGHLAHHEHPLALPHPGRWRLLLDTDARVYSDAFGDVASGDIDAAPGPDGGTASITIAAYSALVYGRAD